MRKRIAILAAVFLALVSPRVGADAVVRGTGDLGIVIERAAGSIQIIETTGRTALGRVTGLGDLSHATAVFSRDGRYAYVFGRDGGLSKVDLLLARVEKRIVQAGNSIGGAVSQDGALIAVANYEPGGVRVFDARTLEAVADIPAAWGGEGARSKVGGLADLPGRKFAFTLYDAGEIWVADVSTPAAPAIAKYKNVGKLPYDALITPDGRQVWVNFAHPLNDTIQVIDTATMKIVHTFKPGRAVLHMEFTPKGEQVWISLRDEDRVDVFDTNTFARISSLPADKPSGILFTARANRIGL